VLAEFGLDVPPDVEVRVWDSNAEIRYLVIPIRPEGSESATENELVEMITRNSMIGTGPAQYPSEEKPS
jgi:nitrile hydratase